MASITSWFTISQALLKKWAEYPSGPGAVKGEHSSFNFLCFHGKGQKASVLLVKGEIKNPYNLCHQLSFQSRVTTKLEKGDSLLTNSFMVFQLLPLGIVNTQQSVLGLPSLVKKARLTIPQLQPLNSGLLFEVGLFHKSEMSKNLQTLFFCIC